MNAAKATVYLIDDDASVRRSLGRIIRTAGHEAEPFESAEAFLEAHTVVRAPSCLLLDIQMPGVDGLTLQRTLRDRHQELPIIFLTGHGDIPSSVRAMKDGAVDFLPKPVEMSDLLGAIEVALQRSHAAEDERLKNRALCERFASLTPREREVMRLVVEGRLNKQIASALGTVEKTIKVHRGRVMEKMGADSVADLVRMSARLSGASVPAPEGR